MKKYFYIIFSILCFILLYKSSFAVDDICETKQGFDLYKCRVENICEKYKTDKPIKQVKDFNEASSDYGIDEVKEDYRKNMNDIYSCGVLKSQKKSIDQIKKLLSVEKSGELTDKLLKQLEDKLKKIDKSFSSLGCKNIGKNEVYNKLTILKQTTYELCKYNNYLEYLREHNKDLNNLLGVDKADEKQTFSISSVAQKSKEMQVVIDDEIDHSFKVFPIAYQVYSEYENNYPIHILLVLLREDFVVFRDKLYETISPINQVVYKIANAMSIYK